MDELTLLRRLDADTPAPTKAALEEAFEALTARMTESGQSARHLVDRRRRRVLRVRWAALTAAGATALVAALVLTDTVGVAGLGPGASAQAAELLHQAADETIHTVDPAVRPGQFRQITSTLVSFTTTDNAAGRMVAYNERESGTVWIPADEQAVWTEVRYPFTFSGRSYGPDARQVVENDPTFAARQKPQVVHGKAGTQWGGTPQWTPSSVRALPRDPHLLLQYIYLVTLGHGQSPAGEAFVFIGDLLRSGLVPADLRATAYQAVALIPGVTVTAHAASLDGQQGVAFGLVETTTGIRADLIIDPATGDLIGERNVTTRPIDLFPAGITTEWSSVTTRVVDEVPAEYQP